MTTTTTMMMMMMMTMTMTTTTMMTMMMMMMMMMMRMMTMMMCENIIITKEGMGPFASQDLLIFTVEGLQSNWLKLSQDNATPCAR